MGKAREGKTEVTYAEDFESREAIVKVPYQIVTPIKLSDGRQIYVRTIIHMDFWRGTLRKADDVAGILSYTDACVKGGGPVPGIPELNRKLYGQNSFLDALKKHEKMVGIALGY